MIAPPALTAGGARLRGSLPRGVEPPLLGTCAYQASGAGFFERRAPVHASGRSGCVRIDVASERAERPPLAHTVAADAPSRRPWPRISAPRHRAVRVTTKAVVDDQQFTNVSGSGYFCTDETSVGGSRRRSQNNAGGPGRLRRGIRQSEVGGQSADPPLTRCRAATTGGMEGWDKRDSRP